jgi:hypothetical protein
MSSSSTAATTIAVRSYVAERTGRGGGGTAAGRYQEPTLLASPPGVQINDC